MTEDVRAQRAKFLEKRQAKLDAQKQEENTERTSFHSGLNQPPSPRATDGKDPNTKEENPLEVAKRLEAEDAGDSDQDDEQSNGVPTKASKVDEIKAYLDAQGITYVPTAKKDDLLALIPAAE